LRTRKHLNIRRIEQSCAVLRGIASNRIDLQGLFHLKINNFELRAVTYKFIQQTEEWK